MSNITTREGICNRALSLLKANTNITNLTNDTSFEANLCKKNIDEAIDYLLSLDRWTFATYRKNLALVNIDIAYGYEYAYQLPTDPYCLDIIEVVDAEGVEIVDWKVEERYLYCNVNDVYIKYIGRVSEVSKFSIGFRNALVYYMAMILSEPILHSDTVYAKYDKLFAKSIKKAIRADARQGSVDKENLNKYSWIAARSS